MMIYRSKEIEMVKILVMAILILLGILAYAMCMAAATSDEQAEKMWREYEKYKRRKEKDNV